MNSTSVGKCLLALFVVAFLALGGFALNADAHGEVYPQTEPVH